tara:strand:- start:45 stop:170 length:126 start_codon:yes stop_codon:yes gene_type:complete
MMVSSEFLASVGASDARKAKGAYEHDVSRHGLLTGNMETFA